MTTERLTVGKFLARGRVRSALPPGGRTGADCCKTGPPDQGGCTATPRRRRHSWRLLRRTILRGGDAGSRLRRHFSESLRVSEPMTAADETPTTPWWRDPL